MRVHQVLPNFTIGDAIGNHTLSLQRVLRGMGHESRIFAKHVSTQAVPHWTPLCEFTPSCADVVLYHYSTGAPDVDEAFSSFQGHRILIYHNVTPPEFFAPYSAHLWEVTQRGQENLAKLASVAHQSLADSDFNASELRELGFQNVSVIPIFADMEGLLSANPHLDWLQRLRDDFVNFLFVGRLAPNKRQEDVIRAFAWYHHRVNRRSRLILAGADNLPEYVLDLIDTAKSLKVYDAIVFTGHTTIQILAACYKAANIFLSMSEHEGFGVPLIEAMHFEVPIVAYAADGVAETLGESGVLLPSKDMRLAAVVCDRVLRDSKLRGKIIEAQRKRLADFQATTILPKIEECLRSIL